MWFVAAAAADDGIGDHAGFELFYPLIAGNYFTKRRKDTGNGYQISNLNAGVSQGQLKGTQLLFVRTDPLGEEHLFRNEP